ncbi:MAG TPA: hypothetical protein VM266_17280 [Solirubrobacteraceae bacterium]|nr:hypothetical protein [Solirubrobacteraceae bacterium]
MTALSYGWYVGWGVGLVVVLIAATLLLVIIGEGRRIVRQAGDITRALAGAAANTDPLWEVRTTNHTVDRITRSLAAAREKLFG